MPVFSISPNLGRFFSPDPIPGNISDPQSWNRYACVLNSPSNWVDPLGLVCSGNIGNYADTPCNPGNSGGGGGTGGFTYDELLNYAFQPQYDNGGEVSWGIPQAGLNDISPTGGDFFGSDFYPNLGQFVSLLSLTGNDSISSLGGTTASGSGLLSKLKSLIPSVCAGGGFGYAGTEFNLGIVKGESLGIVAYDSATGGSHGGILAGGIGHYTGGIESVRTWRDWKEHTSPIAFVGGASSLAPTSIGPLKVNEANYGGLFQYQNGQLSVGGYLGGANKETGRVAGGGGYLTLSWSGCHN